jgi:glycosyltransferase involved in cell wall biosynthesis
VQILRAHFDVKKVNFVLGRKNPLSTFKTIIRMIRGILWADLTFSWFINTHAFWAVRLSKLLRKKSIVVIGGFEVAKVPEINYGGLLNSDFIDIVQYVLRNADKVLAVSEFNKKEILACFKNRKVELVYNGVDCDQFKSGDEKENLVITIGNPYGITCKLKGIDTFVKASLAFPDLKFKVMGTYDLKIRNHFNKIAPNVEFTGALPHEKVLSLMKKAKIYCQLSFRESFGMSLAEAMSCECVPVVTDRGAMPEVVGDTGYYVPYGDIEATIEAIKMALRSDKGKIASERINMNFSLEKREKRLKEIIETELWNSQ